MPKIDDPCDDADDGDDDKEDVIVLNEVAPMTAEERSGPYQKQGPGDGADNREDREFPEGVAGDTGREGDKGADAGQAAQMRTAAPPYLLNMFSAIWNLCSLKKMYLPYFKSKGRPPYEPSQ